MKQKKRKIFKKEDWPLYIMALPALAQLILFNYLPMGGITLAFKQYNLRKGIWGSPWNGLKNFRYLFATTDFWIIVRNTIGYNLIFLFLGTVCAVVLALIMGEIYSKRAAKVYQTVVMMPNFLSWAAVGIFVNCFLHQSNGFVNQVIRALGGEGNTNWYLKIEIWPWLLILVYLWKSVGYKSVVYVASIAGISPEYYEAAMLDGANRYQLARYITLPHLRTIITLTLIMAMGGIFGGDFGLFYIIPNNSGPLYPVTNIVDTYIYNGLKNNANIGVTTATGFLQSVIGTIFLVLANTIVSKIDPDNSLF